MSSTNSTIKNSAPEELKKVSKQISEYAESLTKNMTALASTHENMYQYWKGSQYNDFTSVIEDVYRIIVKEAATLEAISEDVYKKAVELEKGRDKSVK